MSLLRTVSIDLLKKLILSFRIRQIGQATGQNENCWCKPVNLAKITILLDHGYHIEWIVSALQAIYPGILSKVRFERLAKLSKQDKQAQGKSGFVVVEVRWVVERSHAWMERCKSLVKNFERTLPHATAKLNLCFIRLMLKRLAVA